MSLAWIGLLILLQRALVTKQNRSFVSLLLSLQGLSFRHERPPRRLSYSIDLVCLPFCFVFDLLFCISATTLGCIHVYIYICVCVCVYRYLLLPDQNYLAEWRIQKSESEREKSACVTQGIIIKIDARLRGLFQFRHEAYAHTPTTSTSRHTIDDRDHAKRKLSPDAIVRKRERKVSFFALSRFFLLN